MLVLPDVIDADVVLAVDVVELLALVVDVTVGLIVVVL